MDDQIIIVRVDRSRCNGHARCATVAPEVYRLDEEGYCISDGVRIAADLHRQARLGAKSCPERAITLDEEQRYER